ncbi:MAG: glycosyltransferase [Chloroflexi bacterium]|nr:glycosyltransferase [Chloroflexota bacterium]
MKIALIGPVYPYRGGIAHYTTMLYRAMCGQGHDVLLVSFSRQYPRWLFPGRSDRDPSSKSLQVGMSNYWLDSLNPLTWLDTYRRIRAFEPSVVVLQWWTAYWAPVWLVLGALIRSNLRRDLVIICHNVLPHERSPWDVPLARAVLRLGTRFVVQSEEQARELTALQPGAEVTVVLHPVYDMFADDRLSKESAREHLGLPLAAPVLLFFGMVREYKGLADILVALPRIRESLSAVVLLIAGEFWKDKSDYLDLIKRLGIEDAVRIDDRYIPNEEVAIFFSAADVLVAPYREATGSGVLQMARGMGLPVIATDVCPVTACEGMVSVVPRRDPRALSEAVIRFFQIPCEREDCALDRGLDERTSWELVSNVVVGLKDVDEGL